MSSVSSAAVSRDAEDRLRTAGIAVSDVFNAQVAIDLDCVAVDPATNQVAGYECLTFSEMVSVPSTNRKTLAATWRQCRPLKCSRTGCAAAARSGLQGLFDGLISDLWDRRAPTLQTLSKPESIPAPKRTDEILRAPVHEQLDRRLIGTIFYSVYIMLCLTLMLYWRVRRRA